MEVNVRDRVQYTTLAQTSQGEAKVGVEFSIMQGRSEPQQWAGVKKNGGNPEITF